MDIIYKITLVALPLIYFAVLLTELLVTYFSNTAIEEDQKIWTIINVVLVVVVLIYIIVISSLKAMGAL